MEEKSPVNWINKVNIFSQFSASNWKKYPLPTMVLFLIFLWRVTANQLEVKENDYKSSQAQLKKCNENRTLDAQRRESTADERAKILDKYIEEQLIRSRDKYIQPKIDSLKKL